MLSVGVMNIHDIYLFVHTKPQKGRQWGHIRTPRKIKGADFQSGRGCLIIEMALGMAAPDHPVTENPDPALRSNASRSATPHPVSDTRVMIGSGLSCIYCLPKREIFLH
jgi:hypothetical protein